MDAELVGSEEIRTAINVASSTFDEASGASGAWDVPAGQLEWSCRETLAHLVNCLNRFAALLARSATHDVETPGVDPMVDPALLIDLLRSAGMVLAAVVESADPDVRGWHPYGRADRSGFAAMGCDEILIHTADIASGLGLAYEPPEPLCDRVLRRLFP